MEQRHHQEKDGLRKAKPATLASPSELKSTNEPPRSCPRCESANTKFCYYNNYSSSQPRYFCRACRRYWTQGGTLRNLPHGASANATARRAAKHSKGRPPSGAYPLIPAYASVAPLRLQMSVAATASQSPLLGYAGGGLLRQAAGYQDFDPSVLAEFTQALPPAGKQEGDKVFGNFFGGFMDGSMGEETARRIPPASSGPYI